MHCSNRFSLYPFSRSWFWQVLSQTKQYQIVYFTWGPQLETIICESLLFPGYGVVGWYSTCTLSWRCWLWAGTGEGKCQNMLLHSSRMVPRGNLIRMLFRLSSVCAAAATMLCRWWLCFVTPIAQYMCIAFAPRMRMSAAKRQDLQRWLQNSWPSRMATSALCKAHTVVASCPSKRSATSMARAIGACLGWGGWFLVNSIMEYFVPILRMMLPALFCYLYSILHPVAGQFLYLFFSSAMPSCGLSDCVRHDQSEVTGMSTWIQNFVYLSRTAHTLVATCQLDEFLMKFRLMKFGSWSWFQ